MKNKQLSIILVGSLFLLFSSCRINKGLITSSSEENNFLKQQNRLVKSKIDAELEFGNIEPIITTAFEERYEAIEEKTKAREEILLNSLGKMGAKKAKNILDSLNLEIEKDKVSLDILLKSLSKDSYYEFPANAFFGAGKYNITEDKVHELKTIFSSAIDSIATFSNQYPNNQLTLMLVTYGYADGQGFREGSPLHEFLTKQLAKESPSREELNLKLSELRAIEIVNFIDTYSVEKKEQFAKFGNITRHIKGIGKGEELPNKKRQYNEDDERRRIVKFFWKVLPTK